MYEDLIKRLLTSFSQGSINDLAAEVIKQLLSENERLKEIIRKEEWLCRRK